MLMLILMLVGLVVEGVVVVTWVVFVVTATVQFSVHVVTVVLIVLVR